MGLIDAKSLKRAIMDSPFLADWCKTAVNRIIDAQTTKGAEPVRHGRWLRMAPDASGNVVQPYKCSLCGRCLISRPDRLMATAPYCHCGAKMDGGR